MISGVADTADGDFARMTSTLGTNAPEEDAFAGSETLWLLRFHIEDVSHPAELGKSTRLHLSHQVGAMHLHCTLREADIVGNLFVQATRHDMEHDLTLAGA